VVCEFEREAVKVRESGRDAKIRYSMAGEKPVSEGVVVIEVENSEKSFFTKLAEEGHNIEIVEAERFEGLKQVVDVIVALSPAITPLITAYFVHRPKKRVKINGKTIDMEGYSAKEIEEVLAGRTK
jgi:hypothetical protein